MTEKEISTETTSHIQIRKLIKSQTNYAGRSWSYEFRSIPVFCQEKAVINACNNLFQCIKPITKNWDEAKNSEWISRIYFAAKMILSATVLWQSLEFAIDKNLRPVTSYLEYYTVFHTLRTILLTNPQTQWDDGKLLMKSHKKTINEAIDVVKKFDKNIAEGAIKSIFHLKALRELISYRAPSSGDDFPRPNFDVIGFCRLCAEIAQMQSELFEVSVLKTAQGEFSFSDEAIQRICNVEIEGFNFDDYEDNSRMRYLQRKHPRPTNILCVMSEGHVEDFLGSWCSKEKTEGQFNPDDNWRIIFDVP